MLKKGDSGERVEDLQRLLIQNGASLSIDGSFGEKTFSAVKRFQLQNGLVDDGIVGPKTLEVLRGVQENFIFAESFDIKGFEGYIGKINWTSWRPSLIVIHHTAMPSLGMRPNGFEAQHMYNIMDGYREKGWSCGPHLFVDDKKIWSFGDLRRRGIHAVSFNSNSIGIEMLGNFDEEDPSSGRGRLVVNLTCELVKILLKRLNLDKSCIRFHRDDPKTSKTCPGTKISKGWFLSLL